MEHFRKQVWELHKLAEEPSMEISEATSEMPTTIDELLDQRGGAK